MASCAEGRQRGGTARQADGGEARRSTPQGSAAERRGAAEEAQPNGGSPGSRGAPPPDALAPAPRAVVFFCFPFFVFSFLFLDAKFFY